MYARSRTLSTALLALSLLGAPLAQANDDMGRYLQMDCPALQKVRDQLEQAADQLSQQGSTVQQQQNAQQLAAVKLLLRRKACPAL